jgi:hypothetical protein
LRGIFFLIVFFGQACKRSSSACHWLKSSWHQSTINTCQTNNIVISLFLSHFPNAYAVNFRTQSRGPTSFILSSTSAPSTRTSPSQSIMSGAASSAATSRLSSFMNHPAGPLSPCPQKTTPFVTNSFMTRCIFYRPQNGVLLGPVDEMVSRCSRCKRSQALS